LGIAATKLDAAALGSRQPILGALANQLALFLGQGGIDVEQAPSGLTLTFPSLV
jgi:hypothetical protein